MWRLESVESSKHHVLGRFRFANSCFDHSLAAWIRIATLATCLIWIHVCGLERQMVSGASMSSKLLLTLPFKVGVRKQNVRFLAMPLRHPHIAQRHVPSNRLGRTCCWSPLPGAGRVLV